MNHIKLECFMDGGPSPSVYYADKLQSAFREVCLAYNGKRRVRRSELEPLWNFAETMATARLFGVDRRVYSDIDNHVSRMGRASLLTLSLQSFLTPALSDYMRALRGNKVFVKDAVLFYVRLTATYEWMSDNYAYLQGMQHNVGLLSDLMSQFEQVVEENHRIMLQLADCHTDVRVFWRLVLSRVDRRFIDCRYTELAG